MGIWIELGIFIIVLVFALWQWHDARQALARTRAEKAHAAQQAREKPAPPQQP